MTPEKLKELEALCEKAVAKATEIVVTRQCGVDDATPFIEASAALPELLKAYRELQEESELQEKGFDLRRAADQRAIKRWQEATGRTLVLPDHANLCVWLMEKYRELQDEYDLLWGAAEAHKGACIICLSEEDAPCCPLCKTLQIELAKGGPHGEKQND